MPPLNVIILRLCPVSAFGCITNTTCGSLAVELSWLWEEGGAHILPQMRLWKEREAGLEQAKGDKRAFSGVISAEKATQTSMPKTASGIL